jgi:diacylglycerol kinase family enzyme
MKIALILNRDAGALRNVDAETVCAELAGAFRAAGHGVASVVIDGDTVVTEIGTAAKAGTDALVVGGGDGTISAAAATAAETGIALGILPLGTMNFFARSLGIPAETKAAADALAKGQVTVVDCAKVNGRTFIHSLSLGLHPRMVAERDKIAYRSRYAKMLGSVRAFFQALVDSPRFLVSIGIDDTTVVRRSAGVVTSNNRLGSGHLPYADRLDQGTLGIYITSARGWLQLVRVAAAAAFGAAEESPLVEYLEATAADIDLRHRRSVSVTLDGELVRLSLPLTVEIVPRGLKVLSPGGAPSTTGSRA